MLSLFESYSSLFIYPTVAVFLSLVFTYVCIRILPVLGYIDRPGGRHIHEQNVPRGGGIAVILAFFITLGFYALSQGGSGDTWPLLKRLLWPAMLLGGLGLVDDRWELKSWYKLLVQFLVVLIIWYTGPQKFNFLNWEVPWFLSLGFLTVWVIIIINAFNLIDGLDGLASGLAVVSAVCMAVWFLLTAGHASEAICMLILAGACLGFLRYNFHPAKIFLGDTGSTFLGLIFAIISLSTVDRVVTITSLLLPLLAIGVPLFDVVLAVWRRSARKLLDPDAGGIMEGDKDHLHHRLLRQTKKQTTTAVTMYLIGCLFSCFALLMLTLRDSAPAVAYVILLIAFLIMIRQLAVVELFDSVLLIQRGLAKPRKGLFVNIIHPFVDFFMIACSFFITSSIFLGSFQYFSLFIYAFAPVALVLLFSGIYRIYWLRAGLNNYWHLALLIFLGSMSSAGILYFFPPDVLSDKSIKMDWFIGACLLFTLLNITLISLERFLLHYAEGFWVRKLYLQYQNSEKMERILIYGGGLKCRLYINYLFCANRNPFAESVIGIMDDDVVLHGLRVYGFKVLGGLAQIEEIYLRRPFERVIVTSDSVPPENLVELRQFCEEKKIKCLKLSIAESEVSMENAGGEKELKE